MLAFRVARSGTSVEADPFFATTSMRIDYLEAVTGEEFEVECQLLRSRGRNAITEARFFQDGKLAVFAVTTLLVLPYSAAKA
jgi:acyl-coenzyme A thioesterase PaaI-like protein